MGRSPKSAAHCHRPHYSGPRPLSADPGKLSYHAPGVARRDFIRSGLASGDENCSSFMSRKYDRYNPPITLSRSIIILLTWMYLTCLLLLLGGKLNAILRREHERELQNAAPTPQPA